MGIASCYYVTKISSKRCSRKHKMAYHCAVMGCSNGSYRLKKWKNEHKAGKMDIIPTKNKNLTCVKLTSVGIPPKKNLKNFISDKMKKHLTL